ncbi:MAG: selenocysteine-specific translation elongation factor [Terriglobia bacterium]|nr:selenocysteine-specific translation elongation factor [Terriglobia bacterium]
MSSAVSVTLFGMKSVIVGTAGHIDHGKSALVKALTGTDPDRWEEEKRRGITIDLGFASLDLHSPGGEPIRIGFVDVPGHERFVRNMLAGVGGMDIVLLIVSADEGIKPQTREHFDICRLLSIPRGITVITKSDLVDAETLDVVRMEVAEFLRESFLENAPIIPVSALAGIGLEQLTKELARIAAEVPAKSTTMPFRLPIDRVFTMKGFGTVVTGTLISGSVFREEDVEILPDRRRARIRGIQTHGVAEERAFAGQRTALNLAGVATEELWRGQMLVAPDTLRASVTVDVWLTMLPETKPLKQRAPVHVHAFTAETVAQVGLIGDDLMAPGASGYACLHLANPMALVAGDRFIIRQFSPLVTIGGGVVLDNSPRWRRRETDRHLEFLETIRSGDALGGLMARIARRAEDGLLLSEAIAETGWTEQRVNEVAQRLAQEGKVLRTGSLLVSRADIEQATEDVRFVLERFHNQNPLAPGISREELREKSALSAVSFELVLKLLTGSGKAEVHDEIVRLAGRGVQMKDEETEAKQVIEQAFSSAGLKVPALKDVMAGLKIDRERAQKIVTLLLRDRVLVKLSDDLVFHRDALDQLKQKVRGMRSQTPQIDISRFKDATGVSRKYAIPLLEYLDRERVTRRIGDARQIL